MIHFGVNKSALWGKFKTFRLRRTQVKRGVLHWSTGGPDAKFGMSIAPWLELLVQVNSPRGTGYNGVVSGSVLYEAAHWTKITQHCGGSDWTNSEAYGISIMYPGPSAKPRGIPGEVQGPHSKLGTAWYPPIPQEEILTAAWTFRRIREESGLEEIQGHNGIAGHKNDPYPIDMDYFRRLVFDDEFWVSELAKHNAGLDRDVAH